MQSASTVQVTIRRFGVWNAALGLLVATAMSVVAGWLLAWHEEPAAWSRAALLALALVILCGVIGLARRQPIALRWDGLRWYVTDPHGGLRDCGVSEMRVMLDLGGWMLLMYQADAALPRRWQGGWIPVQRRGIEDRWQSLRVAVHSRRTEAVAPAALDRQIQSG